MPKKTFDEIFKNTDDAIENILDKTEKQLHFGMRKISKSVLKRSASLVEGGNVSGTLIDAQKVQQEFIIDSEPFIEEIIASNRLALSEIEKAVDSEFKAVGLREYDDVSLDVLRDQIEVGFNSVVAESVRQVGELMYDAVLTGMPYDDFVSQFQDILGPDTDPDFFLRNAQMNYYQSTHIRKAELAGLDEFLYYGNVMANSRPWCIVRAGKVFTKEQINSWNGDSWKGKSCQPMICRGGYNCRHHWRGIKKSWVKDGSIKPQSIFDEDDELLTPAIRRDIEKELTILNKTDKVKTKKEGIMKLTRRSSIDDMVSGMDSIGYDFKSDSRTNAKRMVTEYKFEKDGKTEWIDTAKIIKRVNK